MANEIATTIRLVDSAYNIDMGSSTATNHDRTAAAELTLSRQIATQSGVAIEINSAITTLGWVYLKNTDSTQKIYVGPVADATYCIELFPGEEALFPAKADATLYVDSDGGSPVLEYCFLER